MTRTTMKWIIIALLLVIILLLSLCLYLDVDFTAFGPSWGMTETSDTVRSVPPDTTPPPVSTTLPPVTSLLPDTEPPVTTPVSVTTPQPITTPEPPATTEPPVTTVAPVTEPPPPPPPETTERPVDPNAPLICIDPGHGFEDPGAGRPLNGQMVYEDKINLALAFKLKDVLEKMGYRVVMTHDGVNRPKEYLGTTSPYYNVTKRCHWIMDQEDKIDLVISLHCNTYSTSVPSGSRYYILPTSDPGYNKLSYNLMVNVMKAVQNAFGLSKEPGWGRQDLGLLKNGLPSILVECGFLSNPTDLANLVNEAWQTKFVKALADGIDAYVRSYIK